MVQGEGAAGRQAPPLRRLRAAILEGRLPPGARLPASRALAQEAGVARADGGAGLRAPGRRGLRLGAGGGRHLRRAGAPGGAPGPATVAAPAGRRCGRARATGGSAWARRALAAPREPWARTVPPSTSGPAFRTGRSSPRPLAPARGPALARGRALAGPGALRRPGRLLAPAGALAGYHPLRGLRCTPEQVVWSAGRSRPSICWPASASIPVTQAAWRSPATRRRGPSCKRPGPAWCPWRWTTGGW